MVARCAGALPSGALMRRGSTVPARAIIIFKSLSSDVQNEPWCWFMTDIFISYSSRDRYLVQELCTFLGAQGWSVWWDRNLLAGDPFTGEIVKQLNLARVAIVI